MYPDPYGLLRHIEKEILLPRQKRRRERGPSSRLWDRASRATVATLRRVVTAILSRGGTDMPSRDGAPAGRSGEC